MKANALRFLCLCALVFAVAPASAQALADLRPGSSIRLRATGVRPSPLTGELVELGADTLRLDPRNGAGAIALPLSRITELELRVPHPQRGRRIFRGAAIGAVFGAAMG
ncbi:hypothetical protein BH20GEM2_BH20GEM2_17820 [soil metagenome]